MSNLTAKEILEQYRAPVWATIQKYLTDPDYPPQFAIPPKYQTAHDFHWNLVTNYPKRLGKYLRPTLLILTAQAMGIPLEKTLLSAAAMQLSEDWILIHDDIEDNSEERRSAPALHKIYGVELAVNAGDSLHEIMWKVLSDNRYLLGPETTFKLIDEFHMILARTTLGQTTEIKWNLDNKTDISDVDWYFIANSKTSYYTIAGPLRLGGIIAKASDNQLSLLTDFGVALGKCFQLVDDILDITGNFGGLKNQQGNDLYEGKRTVMLGHLLRTAKPEEKTQLTDILARPRSQKTSVEIGWIAKLMFQYGSVDYAKNLATNFKNQAYEILDTQLDFLKAAPAKNYLKTLTHFVLERDH